MSKDYLTRQPYLDLLKSIIKNQKDNPKGYSFAIDGEWGSGKTWILQNLEEQLLEEQDNKYLIFHYNAWENDFYEEPLNALLSVMIESLDKFSKKEQTSDKINAKLAKTTVNIFKNLAISVVNTQMKNKTGLDFRDVINDFKEVGDAQSKHEKIKKEIDDYIPIKNVINEIHNQIEILSKKVNILLFVDELDRCLPEYAIKVLERLHHICNEMPIIQIIVYSGNALANSVAQVYGGNLSDEQSKKSYCSHYMEKFVRLILPLGCGISDTNINILYEGVEQSFVPTFDESADFLIYFHNLFLRDIPIRNRKNVLETVKMIHELTLATNDFKKMVCTYELLCSEIILVIDKVLLHAHSPLNIHLKEEGSKLSLTFDEYGIYRYDEVLSLGDYKRMIERISASFNKSQIPGWQKELYHIQANSCASIVLLILAHGDNIQIISEFSHLLGRPSVDIVNQSKRFIVKFYELLYQIL